MIALMTIIAYVLAIMMVLTIAFAAVAIGFGIPMMIVEATNRCAWWLLMLVTMPVSCLVLFWLIKMIAIYGGIT